MMDRIIRAVTFKQGVYNEVKSDTTFTQNAWIIVAVATLLFQLGSSAKFGIGGLLVGTILGTVFAVGGFALACYVLVFAAKTLFQITTTFEEMVRVLGLAYVWYAVGVLAIVLGPIGYLASLLVFVAMVFALKETLDLDWVKAIILAVCAGIVVGVILAIASAILLPLYVMIGVSTTVMR